MDDFNYKYEYWSLYCKLRDFVNTTPVRTDKLKETLYNRVIWFKTCIKIYENKNALHSSPLGDLHRGDVVLVELGENFGKEFSGQHPAVVLRDSLSHIDQVFVLPLTSKKPKAYNPKVDSIYLEFKRIHGLRGYQHPTNRHHRDNYKHWCNILNVRNISRCRIYCPPNPCTMDGKDLNRISKTIKNQMAL